MRRVNTGMLELNSVKNAGVASYYVRRGGVRETVGKPPALRKALKDFFRLSREITKKSSKMTKKRRG